MILEGEFGKIELNVIRKVNPKSADFWDANWLVTQVKVDIVGFKANFETNIMTNELQNLLNDLKDLSNNKNKSLSFTTMEEGISLFCEVNRRGIINCSFKVSNNDGTLSFELITDFSSINKFTTELNSVVDDFPIID